MKKIFFIFIILLISSWGYSYYFYDDFSASSANWIYKFQYSRALGIWGGGNTFTQDVNANRLRFTGQGYTAAYSSYLYGFGAILTNRRFTASKEEPFGFEITRISSRLDYHNDTTNPESGRMRAALLLYLSKYTNSITNGNIGAKFEDFITFIEFSRAQLDSEPNTQPFSFWTTTESGTREDSFNLSSLARPNSSGTVNFVNYLEWSYDDYWSKGTYNTGGSANNFSYNSNVIKFRVTTDGERAYLYFNPNPDGVTKKLRDNSDATFYNEFYLIGSIPITFTNDIVPMIALANNRPDAELIESYFDDFVIRTVASNVVAEISPGVVKAGQAVDVSCVVRPVFSTVDEAGIQEVYIKLPEGYSWTTAMTNSLVVRFINTNDGSVYQSFTKVSGDLNPSSGNVAISIKESGRTLKIRFNAQNDTTYDVFHPNKFGGVAQANQRAIQFIFSNFITSGTADNIGKDFEIYVNNEKYSDTAWTRVATTGRMKARSGNAMNLALLGLSDTDSLTFKTVYDPVGLAGLRAGNVLQGNKIYEGDSGVLFHYDFSTLNAGVNNAYIDRIEIDVPTGFTIDPTSLNSDKIGVTTNIYLTNSGKRIVVNYKGQNTLLPPISGGDTLHFSILSTTNFDGTNQIKVNWPVVCYSSIPGTMSSNMLTNELYPFQSVLVRKKPPIGEAYVNDKYLRNTYYSNNVAVVVKNKGASGNKIYAVRIALDDKITNVIQINTSIPSTNARYVENGTNFIFIDYAAAGTNIMNGANDTVSFFAFANVIPLTNENITLSLKVQADNKNGDGWMDIPAGSDGLDLIYYTPFAEIVGYIDFPNNEDGVSPPPYNHIFYTDINFGTNILIKVRNNGEERNIISRLLIEFPLSITNVVNPLSITKGGIATNYKISGTNFVEIFYTNVVFNPSDEDRISVVIFDNISSPTNIPLKIYAKNTTNYKEGSDWVPDNLTLNYIYPKPLAKAYVDIGAGFIDTATNKETIYITITNEGRSGNIIQKAEILFDTTVFTNALFINSTLGGVSSGFSGGKMEIFYSGNVFTGGQKDIITLEVYDKIDAGSKNTTIGVNVSNQRWLTNLSAPTGKTLAIDLIPPPTLYAYKVSPNVYFNTLNNNTNTNVVIISISNRGWGSNLLDRIKINIPSFLVGKIVSVSNEMLGITNPSTALKISNGNTIWLEYDKLATNLYPGKVDNIFIGVKTDFDIITNTIWLVEAANNSTNADGSYNFTNNGPMMPAGTNYLYFVEKPLAYTTNTNLLASTVSNYLTFMVFNGGSMNGVPVKKVRIGLPYPFSGVSNVSSGGLSANTYSSGGTNFVEVDYGSSGLIAGANDSIKFWAYDIWVSGESDDKVISFEVDYGDGSGYKFGGESPGNSLKIKFVNPHAYGAGYITPEVVSHDFEYYDYTMFIKNTGISGNNVLRLIVEAPTFVTNLSMISSTKGAISSISNQNTIIIYYTNVGNLLSGEEDSITLRAYDNVEFPNETFGSWKVYVDNTLDNSGLYQAGVYGTGSYNLTLKAPGYQSLVYIEASNSISTTEKNKIYTSISTNILSFYVNNTGTFGNYLESLRIKIPDIDTLLLTNYVDVTNNAVNSQRSVSNGYIWIKYNTPLSYNEGDVITIKIIDNILHKETNVVWSADAAYTTSAGKFRPATLRSGKSLNINYVSPMPVGVFSFNPSEIYYKLKSFTNILFISNTGEGSSDWDLVEITIPQEFATGFDKSLIFGTAATNIDYDSVNRKLRLYYSNFPTKTGEYIYIPLTNTSTTNKTVNYDIKVRNYVNTASATGNNAFLLTTIPEYFVTPNVIDTATSTNNLRIEVWNTINGEKGIKKLRIAFPTEFKEIISIDSLILSSEATSVSGPLSSLVIDYSAESKEISKSDVKDIINIKLRDDFEIGNVMKNITIEADAGVGFVPLNVRTGNTNIISFVMPEPYTISKISPATIYVTSLEEIINVELSNKGYGSDYITYMKFDIPSGMEDIVNLSSSFGGIISMTNRTLYVDYTANFLKPGDKDTISFKMSNKILSITNVEFNIKVANLTNNVVWYDSKTINNNIPKINFNTPPYLVYANFYNDNKLYIIETNNTLIYRVKNADAYGRFLTNLTINISSNTNIFSYFNITSLNGSVTINDGTNIVISYPEGKLGYNDYDNLFIEVNYNLSNIFKIDFVSKAVLYLKNPSEVSNVETIVTPGDSSTLWITNGNWGIVEGKVFPYVDGVAVKLYRSGSGIVATNINGQNLITSSSSGKYKLTRIPAGNYKLEFSKQGVFKTDSTNIYVEGDKILYLPDFRLRNAPLSAGASGVQE
ncbi:MAG: carboxypeptidase-like regulatory domain-containing protein, partial [Brevinematales bacterium]|nr:carboxypeptidase-like regulatory domain-containing protein [Brevinematales bacterium]